MHYAYNGQRKHYMCMLCCIFFVETTVTFYENVKLMPTLFLKFCYSFDQLVVGVFVVKFCL